ncbi:hypothetical protein [Mumia zhuanghuii]|uniref:Uncharacterized protein n=1 Tax=Mumia zhuanghuii TaxID=2585211 RepID=A0A5C4M0F1_9ACTN|nr:hypothetical protein [Mumia zhuanghuii]TNC26016.1 hypothetical protein FHE65_34775 [Mumia zhuanghuii]
MPSWLLVGVPLLQKMMEWHMLLGQQVGRLGLLELHLREDFPYMAMALRGVALPLRGARV